MKTPAHTMLALVFLTLSITLLSSDSAYAQNSVPGTSQGFVPTAGVKGLPGTQSGSGPGCQGAGGFVPLECFQGSRKLTDAYRTGDLGPFMNKVFVGAISLGAILAVLRLAWAGFVYMSSDMWTSKEHAKDIIKETLLGLFLLLAIWLILYQINPDILSLRVRPQSIGSAPATQQPPDAVYLPRANQTSLDPFEVNQATYCAKLGPLQKCNYKTLEDCQNGWMPGFTCVPIERTN